MRLEVAPMQLEDINQVLEVDRENNPAPWPASAYRRELLHNSSARYLVLRETVEGEPAQRRPPEPRPRPFPFLRWPGRNDESSSLGPVSGYGGMWMMMDEAHITTLTVRQALRGRGLGELLLISLLDEAMGMNAHRATLEVRVNNEVAQNLYRKFGFQQVGVRPRYYSDNNEDAFIMTTGDIQSRAYVELLAQHIETLRQRLTAAGTSVNASVINTRARVERTDA